MCVCVCVCVRAGEGRGATITDRYVHQSVECQYKSQFLVAYGKDVEMIKWEFKTTMIGNSLAVQWLGLGTFRARAWVPSLMGQLRWCSPPHPNCTPTKTTLSIY